MSHIRPCLVRVTKSALTCLVSCWHQSLPIKQTTLMGGRQCSPTTAPPAASAKSVLCRTPEAIYKEMNKEMCAKGISFPSRFPEGPWTTSEEAKDCINKCYAQKASTGCGAFTAVFRSSVVMGSASKEAKRAITVYLFAIITGDTNRSQQE